MAAGTINTIVGAGSLHHLPDAAVARLSAPRRERLEHGRPRPGHDQRGDRLPAGTCTAKRARARPLPDRGGPRRPDRGGAAARPPGRSAFARIVPVLILHRLRAGGGPAAALELGRRAPRATGHVAAGRWRADCSSSSVYLTGIYGGYFGAAQGVILIALLSILVDDDLQRLNGLKNLITAVINCVAAIIFILLAPVAWGPAILLAIGSTIGGQLGALVGRRLSPIALRGAIIVVGTIVAVRLSAGLVGRGAVAVRAVAAPDLAGEVARSRRASGSRPAGRAARPRRPPARRRR